MDPKRWARHGPMFFDLPKVRLAGIGHEGNQLQCAILAFAALPLASGPSRSPTLHRAVASSSHCQPMGPKELQASSRPIADPSKVHSSQKRAHPNPIKNDQTRPEAIKTCQKRSPKIRAGGRAIKNDPTR